MGHVHGGKNKREQKAQSLSNLAVLGGSMEPRRDLCAPGQECAQGGRGAATAVIAQSGQRTAGSKGADPGGELPRDWTPQAWSQLPGLE